MTLSSRNLVRAVATVLLFPFRLIAKFMIISLDRIVAKTLLTPSPSKRNRSSTESLPHADRMTGLEIIRSFYNPDDRGFSSEQREAEQQRLFPQPAAIVPVIRRLSDFTRKGEVLDLSWPSAFEPLWSTESILPRLLGTRETDTEQVPEEYARIFGKDSKIDRSGVFRDKYLGVTNNRTAYARWFRHLDGPRPCAVLLHGYMSGALPLERWFWPVRRLFTGGMDVVLTVLPFHGKRRDPRRGLLPPAFPSNDPRFTIEGFRQVVFDHTGLFNYLLGRGFRDIGVMGMSLGGYCAALLATLESRLKFAVLYIALSSIEDFALRFGRITGNPQQQAEQVEALRRAQWVVNPLSRPSLLPPERMRVIAGKHDHVTGIAQSQPLAKHFGTGVDLFDGGHILRTKHLRAFSTVWEMLREAGYCY
jgi:hypothetical protein